MLSFGRTVAAIVVVSVFALACRLQANRQSLFSGECQAFGVEHGKQRVARHGKITKEYIDYNRRDVQATSELAVKLLAEFAKHPINLQPTKAYSPASIGKAYLRATGIARIDSQTTRLHLETHLPDKFVSIFEGGWLWPGSNKPAPRRLVRRGGYVQISNNGHPSSREKAGVHQPCCWQNRVCCLLVFPVGTFF